MTLSCLVYALIFIVTLVYFLTGGVDFGSGILFAFTRGTNKNQTQNFILKSLGPFWEANHVWLIINIVLLFSCFPLAFSAFAKSLFFPFFLFLIAIILRGAALSFLAADYSNAFLRSCFSTAFIIGSAMAPFILGSIFAALVSGDLRFFKNEYLGSLFSPWIGIPPILFGLLSATSLSLLAAAKAMSNFSKIIKNHFLSSEQINLYRNHLRFFKNCFCTFEPLSTSLLILCVFIWSNSAPETFGLFFTKLFSKISLATIIALTAVSLLSVRCGHYNAAKYISFLKVSLLIISISISQAPYLIFPDITYMNSNSSPTTHIFILLSLAAGLLLIIPSFYYLHKVFRKQS